jgi:hypothetical protein
MKARGESHQIASQISAIPRANIDAGQDCFAGEFRHAARAGADTYATQGGILFRIQPERD